MKSFPIKTKIPMPHSQAALYQQFMTYWETNVAPYSERLPANVYAPMYYITQGCGKRMRPVFMLMAADLFRDDVEVALPACFAVELFHNFTLLHDDIMDEAPLRRGRPTVHEKWDTNTAILSGDLMMIESLRHLEQVPDAALRGRISSYFLAGAVAVCEGQQMDMDFETRDDVLLPEYMEMIRLKTAALLAEGMAMSAACAGAETKQVDLVRRFGNLIGTAFQIQDDILDTYGDPAKFGKKVGGDIAQNKKTFLYLRALEVADEAARQDILLHYSDACPFKEADKIKRVTALFDGLGIKALAEAEKYRCAKQAFACLDELGLPEGRADVLKAFAEKLADRER
jgi:geranylgeranyl diphosphate synthase type II